jgi:hypothetical protein
MRYGLLASMLAALLIAPSVAAQARSHPRVVKEWFVGKKPPAFQEQSWTVHGDSWKASEEEAIDDALEKAQGQVVTFLKDQNPPVMWIPPISFIKRELVKDMPEDHEEVFQDHNRKVCEIAVNRRRAYEEKRQLNDPIVSEAHQVWLKVAITLDSWGKILEEQQNQLVHFRNSVMKDRMLFLLKIMIGMVALLATVAGYIRLDEWSKGYYTNWLRLAAMSCIAAAGWWLLLAFK